MTGNIKGENKKFNFSTINVPSFMYKVIIAIIDDKYYIIAYCMPNKSATDETNIDIFLITIKELNMKLDFDLEKIIKELTFGNELLQLRSIEKPSICMDKKLKKQMKRSKLYGEIILYR